MQTQRSHHIILFNISFHSTLFTYIKVSYYYYYYYYYYYLLPFFICGMEVAGFKYCINIEPFGVAGREKTGHT